MNNKNKNINWLYFLLLPIEKNFNTFKDYTIYEKMLHDLCYKRGFVSYDFYCFCCRRALNYLGIKSDQRGLKPCKN